MAALLNWEVMRPHAEPENCIEKQRWLWSSVVGTFTDTSSSAWGDAAQQLAIKLACPIEVWIQVLKSTGSRF